jgi:hypothetical protein
MSKKDNFNQFKIAFQFKKVLTSKYKISWTISFFNSIQYLKNMYLYHLDPDF